MSLRPPMDEHVAPIEALLSRNATQGTIPAGRRGPAPEVTWAMWICPCDSTEDTPRWLVHDGPTLGLTWVRVPDDVNIDTLVRAQHVTGTHTYPLAVLRWLEGLDPDPGLDGGEDLAVLDHFTHALQVR